MRAIEHTQIEVFKKLAGTFSEALYLPSSPNGSQRNVFGRDVVMHSKGGGLSYLLGKAVSGLRCSALLSSDLLQTELKLLSTFNRLHIPLSVVVYGEGDAYISQLIQTGSILFRANNIQELSDQLLIGQVISEKCLTPVVIISDAIDADTAFEIPSAKELVYWFGNPDERVPDPTISQEMVMGSARRRMPAWLHIDQAVLVGAIKQQKLKALEKAAYKQFDQKHYQSLINESLQAFAELSGRVQTNFETIGNKKPKHILICTSAKEGLMQESSIQKSFDKQKAQVLYLKQLNPMPALDSIIGKQVERIAVLEPVSESAQQGQYYASFCAQSQHLTGYKENGWFAVAPNAASLEAALGHLLDKESKSLNYWLDVPLNNPRSKFPKHEVLLQQIKRNYPELEHLSVRSEVTKTENAQIPTDVPGLIRRFANQGPPYAKISRFFDNTFCLHEYAKEELIADPFQAYPVMPIATASFKDRQGERDQIPVFKPQKCKDIDDLALSCAYGALPSTLITVDALVNHGIDQARKQGDAISQMTPVIKKWVKSGIAQVKNNRTEITKVKDFLAPSFDFVLTKAKFDDEKNTLLKAEYELILNHIGEFAVVVDQKLFIEQESREAGTGELFSVAVDPLACTACGHCTLVGDEPCMSLKPQETHMQELAETFHRFEHLPETPEYSIKRLIEREDFDPFAALLLNSRLYHTFSATTGGDMSQQETVVRYYLALTEFNIRPKLNANISRLNSTIEKLNKGIKELLSNSLPVNQLDALMGVLDKHEESRVNMTRVFEEWGAETSFSSIEKNKLELKLRLLEELKMLRTLLEKGISGFGRPSCTLVLDNSLAKLANYPYNPFTAPVLVSESADTAALTLGVCEGQLRHGLDQIRLQRRADLEASDRYSPSKHDKELTNLSWSDLSTEEQQSLAPVIVLATNEWLFNSSHSQLNALLQNSYPVKIFIIDKGIDPEEDLLSQMQVSSNTMWSFVAQGNTFISQATLDNRSYLFDKLNRSLNYKGNSIVNVLTPDVEAFDIHPSHWMQLSALASSSRAHLQWTFEPEFPSESLASKLSTEVDNIKQDYHLVQLEYIEDEESKQMEYPMTWADWAYMLHGFKKHFKAVEKDENVVLVRDFIELDSKERAKNIPAIIRVDINGEAVYYKVGMEIIEACELSLEKLKTLREWAGLYTEFPDKLRSQVGEELKREYEQKREEFEKELNEKMAVWEANYLTDIKSKIKEKLLNMSGM